MKRLLCLFLLGWAVITLAADRNWYRVGPIAGTISQLEPDRSHPGVWYSVQEQDSRLYRSLDNGQTWQNAGITGVSYLLVHPANGDVYVVLRQYPKNQLFISSDLGRTFKLRCNNAPASIFGHPSDPRILWGSGVSNSFDLSVSYDHGAHWQQFTNLPYKFGKEYPVDGQQLSLDYYSLHSVLVSPLDFKTVYVSIEADFYEGCSDAGVDLQLVSQNYGRTWAVDQVPTGRYVYDPAFPNRAFFVDYKDVRILGSNGWKVLASRRFNDIVSVPGKPWKLYALLDQKQWVSADGGVNWHNVDIGPLGQATIVRARTWPAGSLLAGTQGGGLYEVEENYSWKQITDGFREASIIDVATAPGSTILFAVASDFRSPFLYRSFDSGRTWANISDSLPVKPSFNAQLSVKVDPRNGRHVYASFSGRYGYGGGPVLVSFDAGQHWTPVPQRGLACIFFGSDSRSIYFTRQGDAHLYKSVDSGRTLRELPAQFGTPGNNINDLAVDSSDGSLFVATDQGLFVSKDGGQTAQQIGKNLSPNCCLGFSQIVGLPQQGQYIAVAGNQRLYKTFNQGDSWKEWSEASGKLYPADERGRRFLLISNGALFESTDGAQNWEGISASIDPRLAPGSEYYFHQIYELTDPRVRPLYAATFLGMFRTDR